MLAAIEHLRDELSEMFYLLSLRVNPRIFDVAIWHEDEDLIHITCRRLSRSAQDERQFVSYADWLEVRDDPEVRRLVSERRLGSVDGNS
jgi:hypothetical protein